MPTHSGDISKGKVKSELCAGCHGVKGISSSSIIPNLAGQKQGYLVSSLKSFKNGSRKNSIMASVVIKISDDDIDDLSSYYSSLSMAGNEN